MATGPTSIKRLRSIVSSVSYRRIPGIEGARGMAAFGVVVYHVERFQKSSVGWFDPVASHLWLGVTLFFVLSGFLLYRPFAAWSINGAPWPGLRRYAQARILRIVPAYWVVLTVLAFTLAPYMLTTAMIVATAVVAAIAFRAKGRLQGRYPRGPFRLSPWCARWWPLSDRQASR